MPMQMHAEPPQGWETMKAHHLSADERAQLGGGRPAHKRASGQIERYEPRNGRVSSDNCEHTQIQDVNVGRTAWCLDCGAMVDILRGWTVVPNENPLSDADLTKKRREHNDFWFDRTYKPQPTDPDDPALDAQIDAQLRAGGITRL